MALKQWLSHWTLPHGLRSLQSLPLWKEDIEIITRAELLEIAVAHAILFDRVEAWGKVWDALIKAQRPCVHFKLSLTLRIKLDHVFFILLIENVVLKLVELRPSTQELVTGEVFGLILHSILRILHRKLQLRFVVWSTELLCVHISIRYFLNRTVYLFLIIVYNY